MAGSLAALRSRRARFSISSRPPPRCRDGRRIRRWPGLMPVALGGLAGAASWHTCQVARRLPRRPSSSLRPRCTSRSSPRSISKNHPVFSYPPCNVLRYMRLVRNGRTKHRVCGIFVCNIIRDKPGIGAAVSPKGRTRPCGCGDGRDENWRCPRGNRRLPDPLSVFSVPGSVPSVT